MEHFHPNFWHVLIGSSLRYILFAGLAYFIFYSWKRNKMHRFKIQQKFPKRSSIQTEILYSISTIIIFAGVIYAVLASSLRNYTLIYSTLTERSGYYFLFSLLAVILLHDTYFYWIHRLMHWRKIFPYVHHIHHKSHNPTPLAAFSFHPIEALLEIAILPIIVFSIPVHKMVLVIFGLYMIVMNVIGHLGFELLPARFAKKPIFQLLNTSTHHNMHHRYGRGNYGLYFNLWDRLIGTNHNQYKEEFITITHRAEQLQCNSPITTEVSENQTALPHHDVHR